MKKRWGQCALAALLAVTVTTGCAMPAIQTDEKKEKSSVRNSGTAGEVGDKVVSADQNTDGKLRFALWIGVTDLLRREKNFIKSIWKFIQISILSIHS